MTGEELDRILIEAGLRTGWLVHHSRPCRNAQGRWGTALQGTPGLPDLIFVRYPDIMFWETKRQVGEKLSAHQERWRDHLENIVQDQERLDDLIDQGMPGMITTIPSIDYRVIRPSDREWAVGRLSRVR